MKVKQIIYWFCTVVLCLIFLYSAQMYLLNTEMVKDYFENLNYNHRSAMLIFLYQFTICAVQLKQFEEGKIAIEKCYNLVRKGENHWFRTLENHFLLCLYTSEFEKAWELFQTAKRAKGFKHLLPTVQERWVLHEAYIHFLVEIGKAVENIKPDKKFRKFMVKEKLLSLPQINSLLIKYSKKKKISITCAKEMSKAILLEEALKCCPFLMRFKKI